MSKFIEWMRASQCHSQDEFMKCLVLLSVILPKLIKLSHVRKTVHAVASCQLLTELIAYAKQVL